MAQAASESGSGFCVSEGCSGDKVFRAAFWSYSMLNRLSSPDVLMMHFETNFSPQRTSFLLFSSSHLCSIMRFERLAEVIKVTCERSMITSQFFSLLDKLSFTWASFRHKCGSFGGITSI